MSNDAASSIEGRVLDQAGKNTASEPIQIGQKAAKTYVALCKYYLDHGRVPMSSKICIRIARETYGPKQPAWVLNQLAGYDLIQAEPGDQSNKTRIPIVDRCVVVKKDGQLVQVWPALETEPKKSGAKKATDDDQSDLEIVDLQNRPFEIFKVFLEFARAHDFQPATSAEYREQILTTHSRDAAYGLFSTLFKSGMIELVSGKKSSKNNPAKYALVIRPCQNRTTGEVFDPRQPPVDDDLEPVVDSTVRVPDPPQTASPEEPVQSTSVDDQPAPLLRSKEELETDLRDLRDRMNEVKQKRLRISEITDQISQLDNERTQLASEIVSADYNRVSQRVEQLVQIIDNYDLFVATVIKR